MDKRLQAPRRSGLRARLAALGHRWPPAYRRAHSSAIAAVPLLLLSGLALYLPAWHAPLIPFLPLVYWLHVGLGLGFAALLLLPILVPVGSRRLAGFDWLFVFVAGAGLTLTGVMLWLVTVFPSVWRQNSFEWHGALAVAMAAWFAWHGWERSRRALVAPRRRRGRPNAEPMERAPVAHDAAPEPAVVAPPGAPRPPAPRTPAPRPATPARRPIGRREFLAWAGGGLALALAAAAFSNPLVRLWQSLGRPGPRAGSGDSLTGWPGFQLYTVVPGYPDILPDAWQLQVDGLVERPFSLTFAEFLSLPQTAERETFQCVTGWVVPNVSWQGVRLADLVARARPRPEAKFLKFYSGDGVYTESLTLDQAKASNVLLAHSLNGSPLPRAQGAPVRLVVPDMYGYKSLKWLTRIEFTAERHLGYWEVRGYEVDAYIRESGNSRQ